MTDTEKKIDEEKKIIVGKKQNVEGDSKMMLEKTSGQGKDGLQQRQPSDHLASHRERDRSSKQQGGSQSGQGFIY